MSTSHHGVIPALKNLTTPIDSINADPNNARHHSERNIETIKTSLRRFGQRLPLVVQKQGMICRAGNARLQAARELGWSHIAALIVDESTLEATAYGLADNRTAELADWSDDVLKNALKTIYAADQGLALSTGFSLEEINAMLAAQEDGSGMNDGAPAAPKKAISKPGDLWIMGDHRVICGDSTDLALVRRLAQGKKAACVFTDPPYGVSYKAPSGEFEVIKNDNLRDDGLVKLLIPALKNAVQAARDTAAFYIWHASSTREDFAYAMKAAGIQEKQYLIWAKNGIALGHADYQWAHEPCFYAAKDGHSPDFYADRAQNTVWRVNLAQSLSEASPLALGLIQSNISFSILLNRIEDFKYLDENGLRASVSLVQRDRF